MGGPTVYLCSQSPLKSNAVRKTLYEWGYSESNSRFICVSPSVVTPDQPLNEDGTRAACLARLESVYKSLQIEDVLSTKEDIIIVSIENGIYLAEGGGYDKAILAAVRVQSKDTLTLDPWEQVVPVMVYSDPIQIDSSLLGEWLKDGGAKMTTFGKWYSSSIYGNGCPSDDWFQTMNPVNKSRSELLSHAVSKLFLSTFVDI